MIPKSLEEERAVLHASRARGWTRRKKKKKMELRKNKQKNLLDRNMQTYQIVPSF